MNQLTSQETPSALPESWIDRLFERFSLMYGVDWSAKWAGIPLEKVKASWSEDLAFASGEQIRKALNHCKTNNRFPPTCPEFAGLCKAFAPSPGGYLSALPAPRSGEIDERVSTEIAKFLESGRERDPKDWARQILAEAKDGTYRYPYGIRCAEIALGLRQE